MKLGRIVDVIFCIYAVILLVAAVIHTRRRDAEVKLWCRNREKEKRERVEQRSTASLETNPDGTKNLTQLFQKSTCTFLPSAACSAPAGNSVVTSGFILDLGDGLFPDLSRVKTTASLVAIRGESQEPTHFHTSHLMGIVIRGTGYLRLKDGSRIPIEGGDIVTIPRGAYHYFDCDKDGWLDYIALEVSDTGIDYQKHFTENRW